MNENELNKIIKQIEKENLKKAIFLFKRYKRKYPTDQNARVYLLDVLFKKSKFVEIIEIIKQFPLDSMDENILKIASLSFLKLENYRRALKYLEKLLVLSPDAVTLNYLAISYSKLKNEDKANTYFKKALSKDGSNLSILINYANFLREFGKVDDAINFLKKTSQDHKDKDIYIMISGMLRDIHKHDEAIKYCEKAMKIDETDPNLLLILAVINLEKGEKKKSLETLQKIIKINPFFGPAYRFLSLLKYPITEEKVQEIKAFLNSQKTCDINSVHLGLALSNFLEHKKKYAESFYFLKKYNTSYRGLISFNKQNYLELFEKVKKLYNYLKTNNFKVYNKSSESNPIFILGLPRSSTSLVEQILSSHSQISGCGELSYLKESIEKNFTGDDLNVEKIENISNQYFEKINNDDKEKLFFSDKNPLNFFFIGIMPYLFPNCKIILCKRNRMDNLYSIYRNFFPSNLDFSYDFDDLLSFENIYTSVISYWESEKIEFFEIEYEKLITEFKNQVNRSLSFLNLEKEDGCYNFFVNQRVVQTASLLQVREPLFTSSIGSWKFYEKELSILK